MTDKPLKAYCWQEDTEGTGGIVFAKTGVEARRKGASAYSDGDFNAGKATRAAWADAYSIIGHVPLEVMIDHGWWFECWHCGVRICDDPEDDEGESIEQSPIEAGHAKFCSTNCLHLWGWEKVESARAEAEAAEALKAKLLALVPGVTVTDHAPHVYVRFDSGRPVAHQAIISFTFPGATVGTGTFRFDKPGEEPCLSVCSGDKDAWDRWRAEAKASAP